MNTPPACIDAVIVAYNSGPELHEAVDLLLASPLLLTVTVVDNASSDGCVAALADLRDPRLQVLVQTENLGFGRGVNLGAAGGKAPWLLVLNPDCELPPSQLEQLLTLAMSEADLGVASAQLVFVDGRLEPASLRFNPTPRRVFNQLTGLSWLGWGEGLAINPRPGRNEVEACSGALMLLPRAVFEQYGGFDPGYFLHCEDLDLCRRLRDAELRIVVDAELLVLHHKGTSSRQRLAVLRHKQQGMLRYFRKFDAERHGRVMSGLIEVAATVLFALQRLWVRVRG